MAILAILPIKYFLTTSFQLFLRVPLLQYADRSFIEKKMTKTASDRKYDSTKRLFRGKFDQKPP